jgi:hypothetical protein
MGEKTPRRCHHHGWLSVLPIFTERKGQTFSISVGLMTNGKSFTAGFEIGWKIDANAASLSDGLASDETVTDSKQRLRRCMWF